MDRESDLRFARAIIERGWCEPGALDEAMREAESERARGRAVHVGQILLRRRVIAPEQFAQLLSELAESILRCSECGATYRVGGHRPDRDYTCRRCGAALRPHSNLGAAAIDSEIVPGAGADEPTLDGTGPALRRIGGYAIQAVIGRGGMGTVYRARHEVLGREVALKVLEGPGADDPDRVSRFQREGQIVSKLVHPHIVRIHEYGREDNLYYFAMELVEGSSLDQVIEAGTPPRRKVLAWMEAVLRGIDYAHGQGVVHRDLKPANILLDAAGSPRIVDFGLARLLEGDDRLTRTGLPLGTPHYMSPEQCRGDRRRIDHRTDIYALGVILYEALSGRRPHAARSAVELFQRIQNEDPVPLSRHDPTIPRALEAVTMRALARAPDDRYASAGEFADDLARVARGESLPRHSTRRYPRPTARPRRRLALAAGLAGVAVVAALVLLSRSPEERPDTLIPLERALERGDAREVAARFRDYAREASAGEVEAARERVARRLETEFDSHLAEDSPLSAGSVLELAREIGLDRAWIEALRRRGIERSSARIRAALDSDLTEDAAGELETARSAFGDAAALDELEAWMRGASLLSLATTPAGLAVRLEPFEPGSGRSLGEPIDAGTTPIEHLLVPDGHYTVRLSVPGRADAVFPIRSGAGPRGRPEPIEIEIDVGSIPEDMVLVPAGEFTFGGPGPGTRVRLGAYLIDRTEVRVADYARFLASFESPYTRWRSTPFVEVPDTAPRGRVSDWETLEPGPDRREVAVSFLSYASAERYAMWLGRRLPTAEEWEKAARGIDARTYPWGDAFDASLALVGGSQVRPGPVSAFPRGASPYGCLDLCGNVREWVIRADEAGKRTSRGGSYKSPAGQARTFDQELHGPTGASRMLGFRTCRSALAGRDPARILAALADPVPGIRQEAARLAGLERPPPELGGALLETALGDADAFVRHAAVQALAGRPDPERTRAVLAAFREREGEARARAVRAVAFLPSNEELAGVAEVLRDFVDEIGQPLMEALLERHEPSAAPVWRALLENPELPSRVRRRAAVLLADLGDGAARSHLVGLLDARDLGTRFAAAQNLWALGDPACLIPLISMYHAGVKPDGDLAYYVQPYVGRRRGLAEFRRGLEHENPKVRAVCAQCLGLAADREAARGLERLSKEDPDPEVRRRAKEALAKIE